MTNAQNSAIYLSAFAPKCFALCGRDGPKFGRRRSSAEEFGRMFGSATCDYSAEVRQTFGVICGFSFASFCARHWR